MSTASQHRHPWIRRAARASALAVAAGGAYTWWERSRGGEAWDPSASGLPSIEVPATVLVGAWDRFTPPAAARVLVAGLADARLSVIAGAGHMLPLEAPDDVAEAIIAARSATLG